MDEAGIRVMMGEPSSTREEPPTKLWVYRLHKCTMEVTFYPDVETRKFHALNYEVTNDDGSPKRQQQCLAEFSARFPATAAK